MAAGTKKRAMNPILAKELRLGSRSIKLPLAVMFYDLVLAVIAVIAIFIAAYANGSGTDYTGFLVIYQVIGWTQLGNEYFRMGRANVDGQRMWEAISSYVDPSSGAKDRLSALIDSRLVFDWSRPTPVTK